MSFDRNNTADTIKSIVAQQLNIDKATITEDASLTSLGADSLDRVEIVMKLEEDFSVEIDDDAADKILTVGQAIDYIHGLRK